MGLPSTRPLRALPATKTHEKTSGKPATTGRPRLALAAANDAAGESTTLKKAAAVSPTPKGRASVRPAAPAGGKRRGVRGSAPWASRHAAKQAAEMAARNAEPPKPGSARATLRTPEEAERIKERVADLHSALMRIRSLRKTVASDFYQIGQILLRIQEQKLYDAKGYASFESFVDREMDLGKTVSLRLARIPELFQEPAARQHGLEALFAAIEAIDTAQTPAPRGVLPLRPGLPMKPPR